jgi:hypothetical protein
VTCLCEPFLLDHVNVLLPPAAGDFLAELEAYTVYTQSKSSYFLDNTPILLLVQLSPPCT